LRYTSPTGRRREIGIGAAHRSTLAQAGSTLTAAREQAQAARDLLRRKVDPMDDRERRRQEAAAADAAARQEAQRDYWTLARAARDYHARVIEPTRTSRHAAQWISSLENHVPAALWRARLVDITAPAHLSALLAVRPHERARRHEGDRVPETLRRIRQRLDSTFEDAVFHGRCATNPAAAIRRKMRETARVRQARGHFAALPYREAPDIVQRLRAMPGTAARSLEFAILTVARTSEVLLAEWPEFDLDAGTWTVPAGRMKAKKEHTVYLTLPAVEILKTQAGQADRYVFPSTMPRRRGKPQSNMAMLAVLGRLGVRDSTTVHGLCRSTFSTWANETGAARPDVIEACLAHEEVNRVRAAYNRAEFAADRRALLQSWADYLARPPAVVVALKAARGAA
jgi:integrase